MGLVDTFNKVRREPQQLDVSAIVRLSCNEMARSGIIIATFFTLYQGIKYAMQGVTQDFSTTIAATTTISLLPFSLLPPLRRYCPFSLTLVAVDTYHTYTKKPAS